MHSARSFLLFLVVICSLSAAGRSFGTELVNIESVILRNRVVVLDSVVVKKALYVAFSLASEGNTRRRLDVRGRLFSNGALLSEASLAALRERTGNLVFDLPYEMPGGAYTISVAAYDDRRNEVASGSRTLDRSDLRSSVGQAHDISAAPPTEIPHAKKPEDPRLADAFKSRGYVVFARSPLAYIFRESRPKGHEVIDQLSGRAVRNASVVLNFSLYPLRELGKVRISISELRKGQAVLSKNHVQLACVESVPDTAGIPKGQFRSVPALLRPLRPTEIYMRDCWRVWITVTLPKDALPGTYSGAVTIVPEHAEPTRLPMRLTVAPISVEDVPGVDYCMLMTYEFVELAMPWSREEKRKIYVAAANVLRDYRQHGMTTLCLHSPFVLMTGKDGMPVLVDIFAPCTTR
ncbi:MAG TPA: glycoside hydrolase domain-containing protein, partial [Burkholderiales bacterium]|nr:glycoside hydrolase domain-containing protein [Burkholderiales bacterium]